MKGLLLKDFYTLLKQMKFMLIFILLFSIFPNTSSSAFAIVYGAMLPITTIAYDERSKWSSLAAMMPYSKTNLVLSKYILGYIFIVIVGTLSIISKIVFSLIRNQPIDANSIVTIIATFFLGTLMLSLNLPFIFKLGVEKGRFIFIIITLICVVGATFASGAMDNIITKLPSINTVYVVLYFVGIILFNIISMIISIKVYNNK